MRTPLNKEEAIEQYLNGAMPLAAKKEFMARLERDAELRRAVDAELLIRRSVHENRASMPSPSQGSRARFLTMLATVAPEPAATTPAQPAAAAAGKGSSLLNYLAGSGLVKGVLGTVAGAAAVIGTIVMVPDGKNTQTPPPPAATRTENVKPLTAPVHANTEQKAIPASPAQPEVAATGSQAQTSPDAVQEPAGAGVRATATNVRQESVSRKAGSDLKPARNVSSSAAPTTTTALHENTVERSEQSNDRTVKDVPVVTSDSVPVRLNLSRPTIKR